MASGVKNSFRLAAADNISSLIGSPMQTRRLCSSVVHGDPIEVASKRDHLLLRE